MNTYINLQDMEPLLAPVTERFEWRDDYRLDANLRPDKLLAAIQTLQRAGWHYLSAITGIDVPPTSEGGDAAQEGQIELLYHFCSGPATLTLRMHVPYSHPVVPSVCGLIPYATLYERELIEMLGVEIEGTPSKERLLLPDDWPDGVYPLRKSFTGL